MMPAIAENVQRDLNPSGFYGISAPQDTRPRSSTALKTAIGRGSERTPSGGPALRGRRHPDEAIGTLPNSKMSRGDRKKKVAQGVESPFVSVD